MITLREIGKIEGVILYLLDEGSDENFEQIGSMIRGFIQKWLPTDFATKDLAPIYPFVFASSDDPNGAPRDIGNDVTHREAFKFTWGCCLVNAEERIELRFARDEAVALSMTGLRNAGSNLQQHQQRRKLQVYSWGRTRINWTLGGSGRGPTAFVLLDGRKRKKLYNFPWVFECNHCSWSIRSFVVRSRVC